MLQQGMRPEREGLVLSQANDEVAAPAALEFVRLARKRGGTLRLVATGLLIPVTPALWAGAFTSGIAALLALAATALLIRNLVQGLRSGHTAMQIERAAQLPSPLSAFVVERRLLLGTANTPRRTWCSIPITPKQERYIRTLALPAARLHRTREP